MSNWYIDFDSTLYNTDTMVQDTYDMLATYISQVKNISKLSIANEIKKYSKENKFYNFLKICEYFENKYSLGKDNLLVKSNEILDNGSKYVFSDVIPFLEKLRQTNSTLNILTYTTEIDNMNCQLRKVHGSNLAIYFDNIIVTANPKHMLDLNYQNGIFVDDNPKDLKNLYEINCKKVIRIRRPEGNYSVKELSIPQIKEYTNFSEISLNEEE